MTYREFLDQVNDNFWNRKPCMRYGQSIMNTLHDIWPTKYQEITNTNLDCFYRDDNSAEVLDFLEKNWNQFTAKIER